MKKKTYLLIGIVVMLCVFAPYLLNVVEYAGYDINNEYVMYYQNFRNSLYKGYFEFWSFDSFLGNSVLASKAYYYIGDIFAYIPVLLFWVDIETCMIIIHMLKLFVAFVLFYHFLGYFVKKENTRLIFSLIYMLSGWTFVYFGQPMFITSYALFPLLLISVERYLRNHQFGLVFFASLLLVASNYYFYWSISIFLLVYWPIRYLLFKKFEFKVFIQESILPIIVYVLGGLSYCVVLIPTVLFLINSPRIGNTSLEFLFFENKKVYLNILQNMFSYPSNISYSSTFFSSSYYRLDQCAIYSSFLILLLVPQYLYNFKQNRKLVGVGLIIGLIIMILPIGGSLMHGFAESTFRWIFILTSIFILLSAIVYDRGEFNIKLLLISLCVMIILVGILLLLAKNHQGHVKEIWSFVIMIVFTIIFIVVINNKWKDLIVLFLVLLELVPIYTLGIIDYSKKYENSYAATNSDYYFDDQTLALLKDGVFRVDIKEYYTDIDFNTDFRYNVGMYYGFNTLMGYDSAYHPSSKGFLEINNQPFWWFHITNYDAQRLLSTRYMIVKYPEELPHENFKYVQNLGSSDYLIYEDLDYLPFGFTYTQMMSLNELYSHYNDEQLKLMQDTIALNEIVDISLNGKRNYMENVIYEKNKLIGNITVDGKQILFLSIPYDDGWKLKIDGKQEKLLKANASFMACVLDEGSHTIELEFIPRGLKFGAIVSVVAACLFIFIYYQYHKKH